MGKVRPHTIQKDCSFCHEEFSVRQVAYIVHLGKGKVFHPIAAVKITKRRNMKLCAKCAKVLGLDRILGGKG